MNRESGMDDPTLPGPGPLLADAVALLVYALITAWPGGSPLRRERAVRDGTTQEAP
jgi:hypothetical protein